MRNSQKEDRDDRFVRLPYFSPLIICIECFQSKKQGLREGIQEVQHTRAR